MNRNEIKQLIRRRDSLLDLYNKLDDDSNNVVNSSCTIDLSNNSRNSISNIIYNIDKQLLEYCKASHVGKWLLCIKGITPDTAAGLLAYFDVTGKDCSAQFIKYAGCDNCNNPHNNNLRAIMNKISDNFKSTSESLYGRLNEDKFIELLNGEDEITLQTAHLRADRYMRKVFISHLFEEMYREEHDGKLPERYNDSYSIIIEPEVPYTK